MTAIETKALSYLPAHLADAVIRTASLWNSDLNEIRLREHHVLSITSGRKNISCEMICTTEDIRQTVTKLCGHSLYSYSDSIRDGCISADCGLRAGVSGHAVVSDGRISLVHDITAINIRIPHSVPGAADNLYSCMIQAHDMQSVLIFSKPGMGKTTILRELIPLLSAGDNARRVAVIDTRYELCTAETVPGLTDVFFGYPRCEGILNAVRTMSPEYILCDELSNEREANALMYAHTSGIAVCASVHAGSFAELDLLPFLKPLFSSHVFDLAYGILTTGPEIRNLSHNSFSGERYDG